VLLLALYLLWNAHPWDYLPFIDHPSSSLDARAQLLSDKIDIYNRELEDFGRLAALLLVLSGLYVIAFAISSHYVAERYRNTCAEALETVRNEFASLVGDLRAAQEQADRAVERAAVDSGRVEELVRQGSAAGRFDVPAAIERLRAQVERACASGRATPFEISDYEQVLAMLSVLAGPAEAPLLAPIYRDLAQFHDRREAGRARYYRTRANALAPGIAVESEEKSTSQTAANGPTPRPREATDPVSAAHSRARYNEALLARAEGKFEYASDLLSVALNLSRTDASFAAEIRYELACTLALQGPDHFAEAVASLRAAFENRTPAIEKRITRDIDDGGPLAALAAFPPWDKTINDLLLDVNVG